MADSMERSILHLAPHPDDELLGAPATLMALRDERHRVFNLACSLGSSDQHVRRRRELEAAMELAHFEWDAIDPPLPISAGDNLDEAKELLVGKVQDLVRREGFDLIVSPTPHDGHHAHEVVGRAAAEAIAGLPNPPRWWMWGLWAELPFPTLFVPFDEARLSEVLTCLEEHRCELARSNYLAVVDGRSRAARVLGVERTFGFGEPKRDGPYAYLLDDRRQYAELLTEVMRVDGEWFAASPRTPDFKEPLASARPDFPIGWWLSERSVHERRRSLTARA